MFRRLRTWLLSLRDETVSDQAAEIRAWEERGAAYKQRLDEREESLKHVREVRTRLLKLIDALLKGIDFPIASVTEEWKNAPAAALHAVGLHLDRLRASDLERAERAERKLAEIEHDLAEVRHELDTTSRALEVAEAQNGHLWRTNELLKADISSYLAASHLRTAEAKVRTKLLGDEEALDQ